MLRFLPTIILLFTISLVKAQDKEIYVHVGGVITEPLDESVSQNGFSIGFEAFPGERFSIGPLYSRYPLDKESKDLGVADPFSTMDIDGKYYLVKNKLRIFALAGLTLAISGYESTNLPSTNTESGVFLDNRLAGNIGAGVMYGLNENMFLSLQTKYQTYKPLLGSPLLTTNFSIVFRLR